MRLKTIVLCAVFAAPAAPLSLAAQTADLSYRSTDARQLGYLGADTVSTAMQLPTGTMSTEMNTRMVWSVAVSSVGDSSLYRVATDSSRGTVQMGGQTQEVGSQLRVPPTEFRIGATGLHGGVFNMGEIDVQSISSMLGQAAAGNLLLLLPGRAIGVGESWTDTLEVSGSASGLKVEGTTIIRGTYTGDTIVAGAKYNVLSYTTESHMTSTGALQGMNMNQIMTSERRETVLWDSARHLVIERRHATSMNVDMDMPMAGGPMTIEMKGSGRLRLADGA